MSFGRKGGECYAVLKIVCMMLCGALLLGCSERAALAAEGEVEPSTAVIFSLPRATNRFNVTISGNSWVQADTSFPLAAKETVNINASYTPASADVDFGLIGSDGVFHYVSATGGSINRTIRVDDRGNYTLAIRNNSSYTVDVSGYVNY